MPLLLRTRTPTTATATTSQKTTCADKTSVHGMTATMEADAASESDSRFDKFDDEEKSKRKVY
jgi:hypothetical protein